MEGGSKGVAIPASKGVVIATPASTYPIVDITSYGIAVHILTLVAACYVRSPRIAGYIVGWEVFYYASLRIYARLFGGYMISGYSAWSYFGSFLHGWAILPGLLCGALYLLAAMYDPGTCPMGLIMAFLTHRATALPSNTPTGTEGVDSQGIEDAMHLLEQVFVVVIAYMLKDWALLGDTVKFGYVVHHTATVIGALMCLSMPCGLGLAAVNGVQAEFGSTLYSLRCVYPRSRVVGTLYYVGMTVSNLVAAYMSYSLFGLGCPILWSGSYATICVVLMGLRQGALFQDLLSADAGHAQQNAKEL